MSPKTQRRLPPPGTSEGWQPDPDSMLRDRWWTGTEWTDRTRSGLAPSPAALAEGGGAARPMEAWKLVSVTPALQLPGMRLVEHLGEVFGVTVRSRDMISDLGASLRNLAGGEVKSYTELLRAAHREALDRLRKEAYALGANAVVSMRLTANSMVDGVMEIVAYGAAVRAIEDVGDARPSDHP